MGTPQELIASIGGEHVVQFSLEEAPDPGLTDSCRQLPGVLSVDQHDEFVRLTVSEPHIAIPSLIEHLRESNHKLVNLTTRHASLEDVFVKVAGRTLEEADEEAPA